MFIEASRQVSRSAVERVRDALIDYDRIVFRDVQFDVPAEQAFSIVRDGGTYVLTFEDPTFEPPELERDCGD